MPRAEEDVKGDGVTIKKKKKKSPEKVSIVMEPFCILIMVVVKPV